MEKYNFTKAKKYVPSLREMEEISRKNRENYSEEREKELYERLHSKDAGEEEKHLVCQELVEKNMELVIDFLKRNWFLAKTPELMEDLMQEGFLILQQTIEAWDMEKGEIGAITYANLKQLNRFSIKEFSLQPQTGYQIDAKVKKYDTACYIETGEIKTAQEASKELGLSVKVIEAARTRIRFISGRLYSLEEVTTSGESENLYWQEQINEDKLKRLKDEEFIKQAKEALKQYPKESLIFDFLVSEESFYMKYQELSELIEQKTGSKFTYLQIYRSKERIKKMLLQAGILDKSSFPKSK